MTALMLTKQSRLAGSRHAYVKQIMTYSHGVCSIFELSKGDREPASRQQQVGNISFASQRNGTLTQSTADFQLCRSERALSLTQTTLASAYHTSELFYIISPRNATQRFLYNIRLLWMQNHII